MFPATQLRLAVPALAAAVLWSRNRHGPAAGDERSATRSASIFRDVVREPAPSAQIEEDAGPSAPMPERFRRQIVAYNTSEAPGTDHHRYAEHLSLLRARRRPRDPLRHRRRPRRLHLGRHAEHRPQAGMAGLESAAGDDRAPALPAALHGRRSGQSARRARPVSRQFALSHPRHQRAERPSASACRRAASA